MDKTLSAIVVDAPRAGVSTEDQDTPAERTGEYFRAYAGEVRGQLHALCGSMEDAEEMTQEAFARLLRTLREGKTVAAPRLWLHLTARRIFFDQYRQRKRRNRQSVEQDLSARLIAAAIGTAPPDPENAYQTRQRHVALLRELHALPESDQVLLAARASGLHLEQIATQQGLKNFGQVAKAISRIVRRLRARLAD